MTTRTMTTGKKGTLVAKRMKSASGKTYVVLYSKKQFEREEKASAKKTEKEAERLAKKEATQAERLAKKGTKRVAKKVAKK